MLLIHCCATMCRFATFLLLASFFYLHLLSGEPDNVFKYEVTPCSRTNWTTKINSDFCKNYPIPKLSVPIHLDQRSFFFYMFEDGDVLVREIRSGRLLATHPILDMKCSFDLFVNMSGLSFGSVPLSGDTFLIYRVVSEL